MGTDGRQMRKRQREMNRRGNKELGIQRGKRKRAECDQE
jgi:hypothetical protein